MSCVKGSACPGNCIWCHNFSYYVESWVLNKWCPVVGLEDLNEDQANALRAYISVFKPKSEVRIMCKNTGEEVYAR